MGLLYYSQPKTDFSDLYIKVRKKENRVYSEEQIRRLPDLERDHPQFAEWQLRKKSADRFIAYLKNKNKPLKILDVGCGNGWFSHLISTVEKTDVIGLDVNETELKQAHNAFQKENLSFVYADLFEKTQLDEHKFDILVFNSCLQYFENLTKLFQAAIGLLAEKGEIHIIDTPFYEKNNIQKAKQRTQIYYKDMGFPEMIKNYFHHQFDDLGRYKILYRPFPFLRYFKKDSPFCWILIKRL